jgi:hypothetical protein
MGDQIRSNPALDAAINGVQDASQLRETLLSTLANQGQIVRMRGDEFNNRLIQQPETPQPRLEERDTRPVNAERVLYLAGNSRIVITSADGEGALDAIESQLRAALGGQR